MSRIIGNIYFFKREIFNREKHTKKYFQKNLKEGDEFWNIYHKLDVSGSLMYQHAINSLFIVQKTKIFMYTIN